jgi:hypothetical protein
MVSLMKYVEQATICSPLSEYDSMNIVPCIENRIGLNKSAVLEMFEADILSDTGVDIH